MEEIILVIARAISMYWLSITVGVALATWLALRRRRADRFHTSKKEVFFTTLCCIAGAVVGAKALQLMGFIIRGGGTPGFWTLENWLWMMTGFGVFFGGLIGGFFAALIYIRRRKLDFRDITDILVPSVLLFHAFGRIGCFFAGCCHGHVADWGFALNSDVPLIPVQLFEAGFNFLVLIALLVIRPERKRPGVLLPIYLMVYAVGRFVLEFFRGDMGRGVFLLSTSQWISLLVFPAGLLLWRWITKRQNSQT